MFFVRRFSYLLSSLLLLVVLGLLAWRLHWQLAGYVVILGLIGVFVIYWVAVRRGARTPADPRKKLRKSRSGDRPTVLHFYSDFSLSCLLSRPLVMPVERQYRGRCEFIYVDVGHADAQAMMDELKAEMGDWLLFDRSGRLVGHRRRLTAADIERVLDGAF
ncbi:hypothetical protein [Symbiobacterium thermophilum]|uniref:Conserved domain protein n=1 Tax=Symbiobacterium thermophilum (strain DSM 24528 / JCM 14929 / IAM 14863 / T) TaxID=292459 RepID=Q67RS1_SYMTH|nr:hypothetical protein [Symbiobacterium thermophilum]BAD39622.1 conserved domain protein [Symbiobacterium thermophilum IAM 14863]